MMTQTTRLLLIAALTAGPIGGAQAHTGGRAFILLLPTQLYIVGGAAVVALSFVAMALAPAAGLRAAGRGRLRLLRLPQWGRSGGWGAMAASLAVFAVAVGLVIAGYTGSRDPLANPLPLTLWTLWWVGFTFLHVVLGDLWSVLNPWRGPYRLAVALIGRGGRGPPLRYPRRLGTWPAVLLLLAFAWFELIDPAPQDPARLATAAALYMGATFLGMALFGERAWLRHGEAFSVFFRMVAWLAPLEVVREAAPESPADGGERRALRARLPGSGLLSVGALPASAAAFILLALASVSFDGLSRTFWWLDLAGANPLEHPGRTALIGVNTLGLLGTFAALVAAYLAAVLLGRVLARPGGGAGKSLGRFVVSIAPIAFGYHFAHYLPAFLVDAQYAARALSDPFALGWNLFGTRDLHVIASLLTNHESVWLIWNLQVAGIVAAHVVAVAVAHCLALRDAASPRQAVLSQMPMTVLMVGYTLFGLWLLSTPVVG